jgi:hypothetical protein
MTVEFELREIETQTVCFTSTNIAEINQRAAEMKKAGKKVRVVKKAIARDSSEWHLREKERLVNGRYKPLPASWREAAWFTKSDATKHHYAHTSKSGEGVAYTPHDEYGFTDQQTVLTPSRYLAKFFSSVLRPEEISRLANGFTDEKYQVEFSSTAEMFSDIFQRPHMRNPSSGADSCMGYPPSHFRMKIHPAVAYAAGDLQIAFIRDPENRERIVARAIVWPENKVMNRCYGYDERMRDILYKKLVNFGFNAHGSFEGAKLQILPAPEAARHHGLRSGYEAYAMPYIDGEYSCVRWSNDNQHFLMTSGGRKGRGDEIYGAQNTCGFITIPRRLRPGEFRCDSCSHITGAVSTVVVNGAGNQSWCSACTPRAFRCGITETTRFDFPNDAVLVAVNPTRHVTGWIDSDNVAECHRTGEFFDVRVFGPLVHVTNAAGQNELICSAFRLPEDVDYVHPARRRVPRVINTTYSESMDYGHNVYAQTVRFEPRINIPTIQEQNNDVREAPLNPFENDREDFF